MGETERGQVAELVSKSGESVDGDCELIDDHIEAFAEKDEVSVAVWWSGE